MKSSRVHCTTRRFNGDVADALPGRHGLLVPRPLKLLQENALIEASENRCRALITQAAINDTASIAMSVDRLSRFAPEGTEYYRKFLQAYVENTARRIGRW